MKAPPLVRRVGSTAINAVELVRHGGFDTDESYSPYEIAHTSKLYRLRHYFPDEAPTGAPALILVHPVMMTAELWDIAPKTSAVAALHALGVDVWTVDFGRPERETGGLERTLTDHALAISDAVDRVRSSVGRDVALGGQSQGGMFSYQVAAYRRGEGIDSLVTFGAPVDTRARFGAPVRPETAARIAEAWLSAPLVNNLSIPPWAMRNATRMLTPVDVVRGRVAFFRNLHDREALLPRERLRRYLDGGGWTAYPGPAFAELLRQFLVHNRMMEGGFVFGDRLVSLADIDVPILTVLGETDLLATPPSVRAIRRAAPRADVWELTLPIGHFGIVGGATARRSTWPNVAAWLHWRAGNGELPATIVRAEDVVPKDTAPDNLLRRGISMATDLGVGTTTTVMRTATVVVDATVGTARAGMHQLPALLNPGLLRPQTAVSVGSLLDEAARRDPVGIVYVFGDRVIRQGEFKHRVDSIVKGLLAQGMRPGDRIGVLMRSRPSAFSLVAAISRLGATAVMLRPTGDVEHEIALGAVTWVVCDPDDAHLHTSDPGVNWCVLGAAHDVRAVPDDVVDLELVDPDQVRVPEWYTPNPVRPTDLAFVLFTGDGAATRARLVTHRRWTSSAHCAVRVAGLDPSATVYSPAPLHHSSTVLFAVAGAVASGARLALAADTDPTTFWEEVRRYGVSHVSYTWNSLDAIVASRPNRTEQDNPIRVFMGSGISRKLWQSVLERFPAARVAEVFASAEGDAILADLTGKKVGSVGRRMPGTPRVAVVAFDLAARRIVMDSDGFGRQTRPDQIGLLVVEGDPRPTRGEPALRNVLAAGDSWISSGELFHRDADGDLWFDGHLSDVIRTAHGPVVPAAVEQALADMPSVRSVVVYGTSGPAAIEQLVAAVSTVPGKRLTRTHLEDALAGLASNQRPVAVQVRSIPRTASGRPDVARLRAEGISRPQRGVTLWTLRPGSGYVRRDTPTTSVRASR